MINFWTGLCRILPIFVGIVLVFDFSSTCFASNDCLDVYRSRVVLKNTRISILTIDSEFASLSEEAQIEMINSVSVNRQQVINFQTKSKAQEISKIDWFSRAFSQTASSKVKLAIMQSLKSQIMTLTKPNLLLDRPVDLTNALRIIIRSTVAESNSNLAKLLGQILSVGEFEILLKELSNNISVSDSFHSSYQRNLLILMGEYYRSRIVQLEKQGASIETVQISYDKVIWKLFSELNYPSNHLFDSVQIANSRRAIVEYIRESIDYDGAINMIVTVIANGGLRNEGRKLESANNGPRIHFDLVKVAPEFQWLRNLFPDPYRDLALRLADGILDKSMYFLPLEFQDINAADMDAIGVVRPPHRQLTLKLDLRKIKDLGESPLSVGRSIELRALFSAHSIKQNQALHSDIDAGLGNPALSHFFAPLVVDILGKQTGYDPSDTRILASGFNVDKYYFETLRPSQQKRDMKASSLHALIKREIEARALNEKISFDFSAIVLKEGNSMPFKNPFAELLFSVLTNEFQVEIKNMMAEDEVRWSRNNQLRTPRPGQFLKKYILPILDVAVSAKDSQVRKFVPFMIAQILAANPAVHAAFSPQERRVVMQDQDNLARELQQILVRVASDIRPEIRQEMERYFIKSISPNSENLPFQLRPKN